MLFGIVMIVIFVIAMIVLLVTNVSGHVSARTARMAQKTRQSQLRLYKWLTIFGILMLIAIIIMRSTK